MKYLFGKFFAWYGSKWSSQYPAEMLPVVHEEWLMGLNHLTTDEVANGLNNWTEDWPPNLQQFKRACKQPPMGRPAVYYDEYQANALPAPKNHDIAKREMKKIKKILA